MTKIGEIKLTFFTDDNDDNVDLQLYTSLGANDTITALSLAAKLMDQGESVSSFHQYNQHLTS